MKMSDWYKNADDRHYLGGLDFDEEALQYTLRDLLDTVKFNEECTGYSDVCWDKMNVRTFEEAGMMTRDKGLLITLPDGSEFQLTIIQRR